MPNFEGKNESVKPGSSPDSAIKLFGKTIPLRTEIGGSSTGSTDGDGDDHNNNINNNNGGFEEKACGELENDKASSGEEISDEPDEKYEEKRRKVSKPVACPRCESMDTKFCYFNNYSVNQPRHYCRNCQRYWTAGGSLRNVPVGAGRRKNKPSLAIHHTHIVEGNPCVWNDGQDCIPGNSEKLVKVEAFCTELGHFGQTLNVASSRTEGNSNSGKSKPRPENYSHCETLDLPKAVKDCFWRSGRDAGALPCPESSTILSKGLENFRKADCADREKTQLSPKRGESAEDAHPVDDMLCGSSVTISNSMAKEPRVADTESGPRGMNSERENKADAMDWGNGFYSASFMGSPWPLYYNGCWGNASPGIHGVRSVQTKGMPWCQPGTRFLPAVNGTFASSLAWGMPWSPVNVHSSPTALGKHQRDQMSFSKPKIDGSLRAPKTLPINDPGEAARSSVQASLGLGRAGSITSDGIFKAFQPKMEDIASANPAALSRSASFVESS